MTRLRKLTAASAAAATLLFTLSGCGDDTSAERPRAEQTATNGDVFNSADVDFATSMIPHHAKALTMVDLTREREVSPEVQQLSEAIRAAQVDEIQQMVEWLTAWDRPIPATMRDHVNAEDHGSDHGEGDDGTDMPGTATHQDLSDLEAAEGSEFEEMWLQMMIEHHAAAVEMANDQKAEGVFRPAIDLATSIVSSQQDAIDHMKDLLHRP